MVCRLSHEVSAAIDRAAAEAADADLRPNASAPVRMNSERPTILTVGHSNGTLDEWIALLRAAEIAMIIDVRSTPYSKYAPQFNGPSLAARLARDGIKYKSEGSALGGRPTESSYYDSDGHVLYGKLAESPAFQEGIARVEAAAVERVALLCSEEDPVGCHRHLLLARVLSNRGWPIGHLRRDGRIQEHSSVPSGSTGADRWQGSLFESPSSREDSAWRSLRSVSRNGPRKSSSKH